jgi:hypothetical protein
MYYCVPLGPRDLGRDLGPQNLGPRDLGPQDLGCVSTTSVRLITVGLEAGWRAGLKPGERMWTCSVTTLQASLQLCAIQASSHLYTVYTDKKVRDA